MKKILILLTIVSSIAWGEVHTPTILPEFGGEAVESLTPLDEEDMMKGWLLEKSGTIEAKMLADIIVPLEIISDVNISTIIVDDQEVIIPFDVELNKTPEIKNYYKLGFSATEIDMDEDGEIDTVITAPEYLNEKIQKGSNVKFMGKNISKEGTFNKKIYMTVEVRN